MSVKPINFLTLTDERLDQIVVPPLTPNPKRQGFFSCNPTLDGNDIVVQTCELGATGYGLSGPNPQLDIKGYGLDGSMKDPLSPPPSADGTPDVSTYNTRAKIIKYFEDTLNTKGTTIEHKYFQMLFRLYRWFRRVVKARHIEFLGGDADDPTEPTEKELDEKIIHPIKFATQQRKFAELLRYGPKFNAEVREQFEEDATGHKKAIGFYCKAYGPQGEPIDVKSLLERRFTFQMSWRISSIWKMPSTKSCGIKFDCLRIDVIRFVDAPLVIENNRNMYGEIPDAALIAAAEEAEAAYTMRTDAELEAEAESLKREREEEEEPEPEAEPEPEPKKPSKKSKAGKK